jgi:hypothetical protein
VAVDEILKWLPALQLLVIYPLILILRTLWEIDRKVAVFSEWKNSHSEAVAQRIMEVNDRFRMLEARVYFRRGQNHFDDDDPQ